MELGWSQAPFLKIIFPWPPFFRTFLIYLFLFPDFLPCESDLLLSFFFINPPSFVFGFTSPTALTYSRLLCPCGLQKINNTTITPIIISSIHPTSLPHLNLHIIIIFLIHLISSNNNDNNNNIDTLLSSPSFPTLFLYPPSHHSFISPTPSLLPRTPSIRNLAP